MTEGGKEWYLDERWEKRKICFSLAGKKIHTSELKWRVAVTKHILQCQNTGIENSKMAVYK